METKRNKQKQKHRQKNLFTMTSGGFVRNSSFFDKKIVFIRAYLVTILKALVIHSHLRVCSLHVVC